MEEQSLALLFQNKSFSNYIWYSPSTREKALRKEGNDNDKITYNWYVPTYILGAVSVFAQFVYTLYHCFIVTRNGLKE